MNSEVTELENTLKEQHKSVQVLEAFQRLSETPDWKLIIEDLYFVGEPQRIADCMADPHLMAYRERFAERMTSIGDLKVYLRTLIQYGQEAVERIPETEQLLEQARIRAENDEQQSDQPKWED